MMMADSVCVCVLGEDTAAEQHSEHGDRPRGRVHPTHQGVDLSLHPGLTEVRGQESGRTLCYYRRCDDTEGLTLQLQKTMCSLSVVQKKA